MKWGIVVLLLCFVLSNCARPPVPVRLYGISGTNEGTVVQGLAHRIRRNSGWIEVTLPTGEYCKGEYTVVTQGSRTALSTQWNGLYSSIYGTAYGSTIQTAGEGMATAIGDKGTVLEVNFIADTSTGHGFGVAKDNKGNVYRLQF